MPTILSKFYQELRHRKVLQTAGFYLVGAWVLLQVAELVFEALGIPATALQLLLAATIVGFPFSLIVGWKYDITREGIRRTPALDETDPDFDGSLGGRDYALIVALVAVAAVIVPFVPLPSDVWQAVAPSDRSVAVMPFSVCPDHPDDEVLATGLSAEVINKLAERRDIKVIARNSATAYAGFGLPMAQTAQGLDVRYVVSGELCRVGNTLVLSVDLTDEEGFTVWGEHFQQEATSPVQITESLAASVGLGVAASLGVTAPAKDASPVNNLAYQQLVIGREYNYRGDKDKARAAFERALEYDPEYAEARYALALWNIGFWRHKEDRASEIAKARPIAEEAYELVREKLAREPDSAYFNYVAARIAHALAVWQRDELWRQSQDMSEELRAYKSSEADELMGEAKRYARTAILLNPSEIDAYNLLATILGGGQESAEVLEQAMARDPFNASLSAKVSHRWVALGRFRQAMEVLESFYKLPEVPPTVRATRLHLLHTYGYSAELAQEVVDLLQNAPELFESRTASMFWTGAWWLMVRMAELGMLEEAADWWARFEVFEGNGPVRDWIENEYLISAGRLDEVLTRKAELFDAKSDEEILDASSGVAGGHAYYIALTGDLDRAIRLQEAIQHAGGQGLFLTALYQHVGRDADAVPLLEAFLESAERQFANGARSPHQLQDMAEAYARLGRDEEAIEMLGLAADYHWIRFHCKEPNPKMQHLFWGELYVRDHPDVPPASPSVHLIKDARVQALCARAEAERQAEASRIRALLGQYDLDELLAPLMAAGE